MAWIIVSVLFLALLWVVVVLLQLPLWIAVVGSVAVALAWGAVVVLRRLKSKAAAGEIERALNAQSEAHAKGARPDQQADIEAMQGEFTKAVKALKSSRLARGGADALAILPWYMIIGPPGAGKSTALKASGLKFPYLTSRGGVRGVGGTRNCDWWLTNEAVLLDTAGRYATEDEDHEEWCTFLDTLKRTRPKKPVNGLIVAVSVSDLGEGDEEAAAELGQKMRERVDEVLSHLQMVLPVYLLFTKCDLLPGFVEVFGDLRKNERGQVWGFTLPLDEAGERSEAFLERFDELLSVVEERALRRMGEERQQDARERIYSFPQQLESLRANAAALVGSLFAENVYQDTPIMRGAYFTSGTQEGRTIDRVMASMAQAFGVQPQVTAPEPVVEAKSYFLRELFQKVLFPDQHLAMRSAEALRREKIERWALLGAAVAVALLVVAFPVRAFLANRSLVLSTAQIVAEVSAQLKGASGATPSIAKLEPLRERLAELVSYEEEGAPFSMRFGMYQGRELLPHLRTFHANAARRLILDPVFRQDVAEMEAFVRKLEASGATPGAEEHARFYDALKLHLLLTAPRGFGEPKIDAALADWIGSRVAERWRRRWTVAADPAAAEHLAANASLYARLLATETQNAAQGGSVTLALPRYQDLVQRLRLVLARVPMSTLAVEKLVAEADGKGYDLNLQAILGGPYPSLRGEGSVRGAFTRRGYDEVLKARLENPGALLEPWVLAASPTEADAVDSKEFARLRSAYFARYIEEWKRFLDRIEPAPGTTALVLLQDLTRGEPPPYSRLFRAVGFNTRIAGAAGTLEKVGQGVVQRIRKQLGTEKAGAVEGALAVDREEAILGPRDVERAFAGLVEFGYAPDSAVPAGGGAPAKRSMPLDAYQEQLVFIRDALQTAAEGSDAGPLVGRVTAARTLVRALIDTQDVGWRPTLDRLLWPPIEAASARSAREKAAGASQQWCSTVALPWKRNLGSRYPFNPAGHDAALADVAEFFRPTGLVWGFFNESLKADVQRSGDGFKFVRHLGGSTGFSGALLPFLAKAQDVTTVLFPAGAAEPQVPFSVRIRPTPKVASVIFDVDGQRFEYFNGPEEWRKMTWPAQGKAPGAMLRVRLAGGREETLQQEGEWGLFRLLETGQVSGQPGQRDFSASFPFPSSGVTIVLDFRASRSEAPFFGVRRGGRAALLAPFRAGISPPNTIGGGVPPCN
ncbi:MAG TPA: type VI secretion system membrane subunit TssM [Anaeromyxobacter sp.]